jgi:hypothetical protein
MKSYPLKNILPAALCVLFALMLMMPSIILAQTEQSQTDQRGAGPPPIEQALVREGDLAIKLVSALGAGNVSDDAEAESRLAEVGITPKNGWIADYPVTPEIAGELRDAVFAAADAGKLSMDRDRALRAFDDVLVGLEIPLTPYARGTADESAPPPAESYVKPTVVNNYYYSEGPPIVTYYPPPRTYMYLYAWVPYPFRTAGYLFPGFFILHDFHRTVVVDRRPFFITNHFRDSRIHRISRVYPGKKFKGNSFVSRDRDSRVFSPRSGRVWVNVRKFTQGNRTESLQQGRTFGPVFNRSASGINANTKRHVVRPRIVTPSMQKVKSFNRDTRRQFDRTRSFAPSSRDLRNSGRISGDSRPSSPSGRFSHRGGRGR